MTISRTVNVPSIAIRFLSLGKRAVSVRRFALVVLAWALLPSASAEAGRQSVTVPVTEPQAATLTGDLFTPSGNGPHPAVILLHGCSGVTQNTTTWAMWLQSEGYAALVLDSFTGRGLRTVCGDPRPLTGQVRASDVFAAAVRLKSLGFIDENRIAAMGFSHGGWTVLSAWRTQARHPEAMLKALMAFYPACAPTLPEGVAPPLLMLLGGQDDWTPAQPCLKLAETASKAGLPVNAILYPDARHAFDAANLRGRVYVDVARGGKGATIEYNPKAHDDSQKQVRQFLRTQLAP
ncbi:MAG TPA: dienelactone hydrolase family protein [Candidatus Methylomirabilis sp.]|nr:dienelactone hydrolase family protein [Candidatus Methylomirabilis sp.]